MSKIFWSLSEKGYKLKGKNWLQRSAFFRKRLVWRKANWNSPKLSPLSLALPQTIIIGFCKQHRSWWDGSYELSHLDLRCLTYSLSTLPINFFSSNSRKADNKCRLKFGTERVLKKDILSTICIICSSFQFVCVSVNSYLASLFRLVPRDGYTSWWWHFLDTSIYIFLQGNSFRICSCLLSCTPSLVWILVCSERKYFDPNGK